MKHKAKKVLAPSMKIADSEQTLIDAFRLTGTTTTETPSVVSLKYSSSPVTLDTGFFDMGDGDSDEADVTRQLLDTGLFDIEGDSSPGMILFE